MKVAIVGCTGLVGSNLMRSISTEWTYHSRNITEIRNRHFDLVINAGVSSLRWKANQDPESDWENISHLWDNLSTVKAEHFIQISTVDVLPGGRANDETIETVEEVLLPYGKHRLRLERMVTEKFPSSLTVRFPHLFGKGLKKGFLYDLIHNNALHLTDDRDIFQFYNLDYIWRDLQHFSELGSKLVHVATEPMTAREVAKECFGIDFRNTCDRDPRVYDLRTTLDYRSSHNLGYMYRKSEIISDVVAFRKSLQTEQTD